MFYANQKRFDEGEKVLLEALRIAQSHTVNGRGPELELLATLADLELARKQAQEAERYDRQAFR